MVLCDDVVVLILFLLSLSHVGNPWIVIFKCLPPWVDGIVPEPKNFGAEFQNKPSYEDLRRKCVELFEEEEEEEEGAFWSHYEMRGVINGEDFLLQQGEKLVFNRGVHVKLVPRYYTEEFHIVTFKMAYSRKEVIKLCKEYRIAGSVTRDNTNSLRVRLHHPSCDMLKSFVDEQLKPWLSDYDGFIDEDNSQHSMEYGSLKNSVVAHRGTATRNDGVESWCDDDAKSDSTYFNAPEPAKKVSKPSKGHSLASRLSSSKY